MSCAAASLSSISSRTKKKMPTGSAEGSSSWAETMTALEQPGGPLHQLREILAALRLRLVPKQGGLDKAISVLRWPFEESDADKLLVVIEQQKALLNLDMTNDSRKLIQAIKKEARLVNVQVAQLTAMLQDAEQEKIHHNEAIKRQLTGLGEDVRSMADSQLGKKLSCSHVATHTITYMMV
ncbi:hypothetical protein B0T22DRAFT_114434 [Podospora appendiculata]|uniref:Uncharacterized protein n=1 Tax=Podospora appendiculata TaxID=314037 RepID=A0AAE0XLQ1_9PEZI|nr:hypothetical protein B0T22DRAFT_114434 [Podospora appendiculata]